MNKLSCRDALIAVFLVLVALVLPLSMSDDAQAVCSEDNWCWRNPLPQGNDINDLYVVDIQTIWAVGDAGTILKTDNGGASWQTIDGGTTYNLFGIHYNGESDIWISGANGILLHSTDGGQNWESQTLAGYSHLQDIQFLDSQNGWAVGFGSAHWVPCPPNLCYSQGEDIWKTTDGGTTWTDMYDSTFGDDDPKKVFFINTSQGWVLAGGEIYRTADGGENWERLSPETSLGSVDISFRGLFFLDANRGWAVGDGHIIHTVDGGDTWTFQPDGSWEDLYDIYFHDETNGWATGVRRILYTTDGGETWQPYTENLSAEDKIFNVIRSAGTNDVLVGGQTGAIFRSQDGGVNFSPLITDMTFGDAPLSFEAVSFSNAQHGWIVALTDDTLYQTQDGGQTWQKKSSGVDIGFKSISFVHPTLGWVVGNDGTILKTMDGGENWTPQSSGTAQDLLSVYFRTESLGWVTGKGDILFSNDGGETWTIQFTGSQYIYDVRFLDNQVGWACGSTGLVLYTENGGMDWTDKSPTESASFFSIAAVGAGTAVAVNFDGEIYRTTDSGTTWSLIDSGIDGLLRDVRFADSLHGWIVGSSGTVLHTNDGGATWEAEKSGTDKSLTSLFVIDQDHRWAVGTSGVILNASPVGTTIFGTIRRSDDNQPITGDDHIQVVVYGHDEGPLLGHPIQFVDVDSQDGTFAVTGLGSGSYHLRVEAKDYIDEFYASPASVYYSHQSEVITIGEPGIITGKDFQLEAGEIISGTLYVTDGTTPLSGGYLSVTVDLSETGTPCGHPSAFGTSSVGDGSFSVHVPEGTYYLSAGREEEEDIRIPEWWAAVQSERNCEGAEPIEITIGQSSSGHDFQLEQGVLLSGTVRRASDSSPVVGDPTINIGVVHDNVCSSQGYDFAGSFNPDDGTYVVIVEPGSYYLTLMAHHYVDEYWNVTGGDAYCQGATSFTVAIDDKPTFDFYLEEGVVVSGTVFKDDGVSPWAEQFYLGVEFWSDSPCDLPEQQAALFTTFVDPTDGTFLAHVPEGDYYLQANTGNYFSSQWWASPESVETTHCEQAQMLSVMDGDGPYSGIDFQMNLGGITGTVFAANGTTPLTGDGTVTVNAYQGDPCDQGGNRTLLSSTLIDPDDGTYRLEGLAGGSYFLRIEGGNPALAAEWYALPEGTYNCGSAEVAIVSEGEITENVNFVVTTGGTLRGTVYDASGIQPLTDQPVHVNVMRGDPCGTFQWVAGSGDIHPDGSYEISGIPPGMFYLLTWRNGTGFMDEWRADAASSPFCSDAQPITIVEGGLLEDIDFQLHIDSDQDGMADEWEEEHYLDIGSVECQTESDNDGLDACSEYFWGTDPHDNDSDDDKIADGYEVQQGTDPVDGGDTPSIPITGSVMNVHEPDGSFRTYLDWSIGSGFVGSLPDDMAMVSVTGPGVSLSLSSAERADAFNSQFNSFGVKLDGTPQLGVYTFTMMTGDGLSGSDQDSQTVNRTIPIPSSANFVPKSGATVTSMTPVFKWSKVALDETQLFYRLTVYDAFSDFRAYASGREANVSGHTVPEGRLNPGGTYDWQLRVSDNSDYKHIENRANGERVPFSLANDLSHPAVPAIDLAGYGVVHFATASWIARDNFVKIIDFDGVASDGSSHSVTVFPPDGEPYMLEHAGADGPYAGGYSLFTVTGTPPVGDYNIVVTDADGNSSNLVDHVEDISIAVVDEDSLQPSNKNPVQKSVNAAVDNVYVNDALYDDFSSYSSFEDVSNSANWGDRECNGSTLEDQELVFDILGATGSTTCGLRFADAGTINSTQADITINSATGNDSLSQILWSAHDEFGNTIGSAGIMVFPDRVAYRVEEDLRDNGILHWNVLQKGDLLSVSPGETVTIRISFTGNTLTFYANDNAGTDNEASFSYSAEKLPAAFEDKKLQTRINLITDPTPTISWANVSAANVYRVRLYSYDDASNPVWEGYRGQEEAYTVPPGALFPDGYYKYRVDARDAHMGFDLDNVKRTPSSSNRYYVFYTDSAPVETPYIELDMRMFNGAQTLTDAENGSSLGFWIKVHDAQGVPENIAAVTVDLPGGDQATLEYNGEYPGNTNTSGAYRLFDLSVPEEGQHEYTFHVTDHDGNTAQLTETMNATLLPALNPETLSTVYDADEKVMDFTWSPVEGASFYRIEIYSNTQTDPNWLYAFNSMTNSYRMPEGFLKKGVIYRYRILALREFFEENVDNVSFSHRSPTTEMPALLIGSVAAGDVNADGDIGLPDLIQAIKVCAGMDENGIAMEADVDGDGDIGIAEAVYLLQHEAGLR